jgi:hypothetical protein
LIIPVLSASAQTTPPAPAATPPAPATEVARKAEAKAEADRLLKQRQAQARSLLLSLASDARSYHDQTVRSRTLARIADALWDTDVERGRELFRKGWEAAGVADQETVRKRQEDIQRQKARTGGGYSIPDYPNLRREVLRLAARRDRELGEEFLQNLKADQQDVNGENHRLALARELLDGDPERALQFANSELANINVVTVEFLSSFRTQNVADADQRFAAMLNTAARNPLADANTVSLLSSYLFTPHMYVVFHGGGMSYSIMGSGPPLVNVAALQLLFFQVAANVLLRTAPQPSGELQTAGIEDRYLVIRRLLPAFEQSAPPELTAAMRSRLEALSAMVRESVRQRNTDGTQRPSESESSNHEQSILDEIDHARTAAERDQFYFQLAREVMHKDDLRARDFVSKIEDSEFRKQAQAYIDATLAIQAINGRKIDRARELIEKGELTHIQRVWGLTHLAKLLARTDRDKSLSFLEDAMPEARRIAGLDPDRPRALLAIANALKVIEPTRAWDAVFEAVKAANSADGFTGEDGNLNIVFQAKGFSSTSDMPEADFDIKGIFTLLVKDDYDRAVELARGFQGETPRAAATIAIARAVLSERIPSGSHAAAGPEGLAPNWHEQTRSSPQHGFPGVASQTSN